MNSVRQSCRPKHQVLILKCYPRYQKGVQEVKPNSSELSYLLYYASTRRSKLQKVGAFLEKRTARDVWRSKIGNVQVTLQILTALIEKTPRDLPLYARAVLTVIETVLRSNDISMVEETVPTFDMFCRHQDIATLSAEQEYATQYHNIVRTYAGFASPDPSVHTKTPLSPPLVIRWRNVGLRAIKSIVGSEALASDGGKQLEIVVPVILDNLYSGGEDVLVSIQTKADDLEKNEREQTSRRRMSSATVQTADTAEGDPVVASGTAADADKAAETEVRILALRCLERIFASGSNKGQIRIATNLVLRFIMTTNPRRLDSEKEEAPAKDVDGNWATSLIELIAKWCPVQDRFIILVSAMEMLVDMPATEDKLDQQLTLASMVDWLLKSSVNMIGLSVIDVLQGLVQSILRLLQEQTPPSPTAQKARSEGTETGAPAGASQAPSPIRDALLTKLQECIGDLVTHIYYGNQVSDMIRAILTRLKPSSTLGMSAASAVEDPSEAVTAVANATGSQEDPNTNAFFSFPAARVTALRAVRNILVVANMKNPPATAGVESRNRVGVEVWEGTEWLLRDPEAVVRTAYADALVTWLQLETNKQDLRIKNDQKRLPRVRSKYDISDNGDRSSRRIVSASSYREKVPTAPRTNFLQLLHLAVYENAIDYGTVGADILLLHILLSKLVENLGVNAVRFGLPMILRLQDDIPSLNPPAAKINVGSLVYGYFWALCEYFNFDSSKIGHDVHREISKRQKLGLWLNGVTLPPLSLDHISHSMANGTSGEYPDVADSLLPFTGVEELVRHVENAYNEAILSSPHSPPSTPGASITVSPPLANGTSAAKRPDQDLLSSDVKEEMLSQWSKEACLASVEKESATTLSISGSKTGTLGGRSYLNTNVANISITGTGSPTSVRGHTSATYSPGGAGGIADQRRTSVPEGLHTPVTGSSRDSTLRVNDLRRVLSVTSNGNVRRSSPLRGRLNLSSSSGMSSSSESMVSGTYSNSDYGEQRPSRPQSLREGSFRSEKEGTETPRAYATNIGDLDHSQHNHSVPTHRYTSNGIPPVPPLPANLAIPGGFPDSNRPSTAPSFSTRASSRGRTDTSASSKRASLNKQKTRSSTGLASVAGNVNYENGIQGSGIPVNGDDDSELTTSDEQRAEVEELLDIVLPRNGRKEDRHHNGKPLGPGQARPLSSEVKTSVANRDSGNYSSNRGAVGRIGRPPY
ncbi:plasma membrane localization protein [Paecilomyces lecythidis]